MGLRLFVFLATAVGATAAFWGAVALSHTKDAAVATPLELRAVRVALEGRGSIRSRPAGIDCPRNCSASFPIGTRVVLRSRGAHGWHLVSWSANCGRQVDCAVVLRRSRTVRVLLARNVTRVWRSVSDFAARRAGRVSVAVLDVRTGTTYLYAPGKHYNAASTAKVQILATALHEAQQAHRNLTTKERAEAVPMIEGSDNDAAEALWERIGENRAVQSFDDLVPMPETVVSPAWGLTQITAPDSVRLVLRLVEPNSLLHKRSRAYALDLMEHVTRLERWGVSAGVPTNARVVLKNGWLPQPATAWSVNSMGWVHGYGRDYVIAVLTDHDSSEGYGVSTIEGISRRVWAALAPTAARRARR